MGSFRGILLNIILSIPAVMIAFTAQGYGKAFVADKLGDRTPRFQGRLTLNPVAHLDPLGFLMILLFGFGWTKPLETNPSAFKRGYKDSIKVSIAPPLANLIVGFLGALIYVLFNKLFMWIPENIFVVIAAMLGFIVNVNIMLAVFTLLPIPGLSGFDIFRDLSRKTFYKYADKMYQYQIFIFLGVILINNVFPFISYIAMFIRNIFYSILNLLFSFI
ncbi:site-2 protease family protein [Clostridium sp. NSJ-6]|uniref:Site-2 protease family protein n=1 Tax=Clostridium hominis TaxID=2763036 RepID=A0ABR7DI27_9CLOT|nr:site-2 protease family protein [Clostridium hominis]MBC5631095.1 site-2 protease family protein [Clostridium hominis]MDU2671176.1 site-2 protease family protein [Clostridium sp.]